MNYYNEIKNKLIDNEIYEKVKDYSKERNRVKTYFEVGKLLSEAGKHYGKDVIGKYSKMLVIEVGKKYNDRTLRSMRQLYVTFNNEIWKPLVSKLSWTIFLVLMPLKDNKKMYYYASQSLANNLSKRELQEKIKSREYERLDDKTKEKLMKNEETKIGDYIKKPILIKMNKELDIITEKALKNAIIENIEEFMKELGEGYSFIKSEYKISDYGINNYIDILLFNYKYNCFAVIELKVTELKKEHIGQIQTYMNYIDNSLKQINQNNTIGIIITKKDNEFVMNYCNNEYIYQTIYSKI